eukprot:154221-Prymnesium_polylepis.1
MHHVERVGDWLPGWLDGVDEQAAHTAKDRTHVVVVDPRGLDLAAHELLHGAEVCVRNGRCKAVTRVLAELGEVGKIGIVRVCHLVAHVEPSMRELREVHPASARGEAHVVATHTVDHGR